MWRQGESKSHRLRVSGEAISQSGSLRPEYRTNHPFGACALIAAIPPADRDEADFCSNCLVFASGGRFPA
jgi:hypothetical protein